MANPNPSPGTRFGEGNPGGPGRPRSRPLTDRLRERLGDAQPDGRTLADALVDAWIELIRGGGKEAVGAIKEALLRLEGRPSEPQSAGPAVADLVAEAERRAEERRVERSSRP